MCTICFATQTFDPARHDTFKDSGFYDVTRSMGFTSDATNAAQDMQTADAGSGWLSNMNASAGGAGEAAASGASGLPGSQGVGTIEQMAAYLTEGYWGGIRYEFDTSSSNVVTIDLSDLTAAGQQLAIWATQAWETVANISFEIVTSGAMITMDDEFANAYAYTPGGRAGISGGIVFNIEKAWITAYGTEINSYSFETYVHEMGHALGLGHQGNYNGDAKYNLNNGVIFTNDSTQMSIMSYFDQNENTSTDASFGHSLGPMMVDIFAIQDMYGAPGANSATAGNTVFGLGSNLGTYMDQVFTYLATNSDPNGYFDDFAGVALTIYDVGGTDKIDFSYIDDDIRLDLRERQFSDFGKKIGVLGIAANTIIENATTGAGDDTVTGNDADNTLTLGAGRDAAFGGAGQDMIFGEEGADTLHGGDDGDDLYGGAQNDRLYGGYGFDSLFGGDGDDMLDGGQNSDRLRGGTGNDRLYGGQGFDNLYGDDGHDALYGGVEADRLYGGQGDDTLYAGSNFGITVDGLFGGEGADSLYGDAGFDYLDGGDGDDMLDGGHQADNLFGRAGADIMYGGQGLDRLFGGDGNDTGYGGDGNDGLFGEAGNDRLYGGSGNDRFFGSSGNDMLFGGAGNDTINGGSGFDTIDGGTGNDILFGRFNADTFVFSDGHGTDTIGDFAAGNRFEKIDLSGITAIGTLADLLLGNASSGAAQQVNSNVVIDTGDGHSITLRDITLMDLDSTDFIF